jgi:hypothetical protein
VPLAAYQGLQTPLGADAQLFRRILGGLSCRNYQRLAPISTKLFVLTLRRAS